MNRRPNLKLGGRVLSICFKAALPLGLLFFGIQSSAEPAQACEDIFVASTDASVRTGTVVAATDSVVKRAVRDIVVKKLVIGRKQRAIRTRSSTSISSSGGSSGGGGAVTTGSTGSASGGSAIGTVSPTSHGTVGAAGSGTQIVQPLPSASSVTSMRRSGPGGIFVPNVKQLTKQGALGYSPIQLLPKLIVQRLVWTGSDKVWVADGPALTSSSVTHASVHQKVSLVDNVSGTLLREEIYLRTPAKGGSTSIIVAVPQAQPFHYDYHFLDRDTLTAVRPPLVDVAEFQVMGEHFTYVDFKTPNQERRLLGALQAGSPIEGVELGRNDEIFDISDDASVLKLPNGMLEYDVGLNGYVGSHFAQFSKTLLDGNGGSYRVRKIDASEWAIEHTRRNGQVEILRIETSTVRMFQTLRAGETMEIESIMGDGDKRTAFIYAYDQKLRRRHPARVYPVLVGDAPLTIFDHQTAYLEMNPAGDQFAILKGTGAAFSKHDVLAIDFKTGLTHVLEPAAPSLFRKDKTALISSSSYVKITRPAQNGASDVVVYDLATGVERRRMQVNGSAAVVEGTFVLRIEGSNGLSFYDIETGAKLWSGKVEQLAEVSPNGSRIAYLRGSELVIEALGPGPERFRIAY